MVYIYIYIYLFHIPIFLPGPAIDPPPPIAIVMVVMAASAPTRISRIGWGIAPGGLQIHNCIGTSLGCCVTRAMLDF